MNNKTPFEVFKSFDNALSGYTKPEYKAIADKLETESLIDFESVGFKTYGLWSLIQYGNKNGMDALTDMIDAIKKGFTNRDHRNNSINEKGKGKVKIQGDDSAFPANPITWINNRKARFQNILLENADISSRKILRSILTGKPVSITLSLDFSQGIEEKAITNLQESVKLYITDLKSKRNKARKDKKIIPVIMESGLIVEGMIIHEILEDSFSVTMQRNTFMSIRQSLLEQGWIFAGNAGEDDGFGSTTHVLLKHSIPVPVEMSEKVKSKSKSK